MISRRGFLTSSSALLVGLPRLMAAPQYDLLIKGGRVLDPSQKMDRMLDVAVLNGKIAALQAGIPAAEATEVLDATGKLVTPGLIDIHAHPRPENLPAERVLGGGVTTVVDGGSRGSDGIQEIVDAAKAAPNRVRILINLSRLGTTTSELQNLQDVDVAATRDAIRRHRDVIVGVKARISVPLAGANDLDAIRRAHQVTESFGIPIMIHVGDTRSTLSEICALLRPGDIVTHVYTPEMNGILDANGRIFPQVIEARRRGVLFDVGHGRLAHITWDVADKALQQNFPPDTITTDLSATTLTTQVYDLPYVLSKFLALGMPLDKVIECVTVNAAKAIPDLKDLGTLKTGAVADITVLELAEGQFEFPDNSNLKRAGTQKLFARAVVVGGKPWKGQMSASGPAR